MQKHAVWFCSVLLVISAFGAPVPGQTLDKLDPLLQQRASNLSGHSQVIVRAADNASLGAVSLLIQQSGGTLGRELRIINAQAAEVPDPSLLMLADSPDVQRIVLDRPILGTLERAGPTVGATGVRQELGYDGAGIGVAVIDSGITSGHDDLTEPGGANSQRVDSFVDFVNGRSMRYDDYGHGTHVAGIIAGNGFDTQGARSGIAPAARLVILKVLDGSGRGRISDVIAAFDYIINHRHLFNIRVVNLSIAAGVYESYKSDLLTLAAKRVVEQGIVVVAAAGNFGSDSQGARYGGIAAPGNAPWVLTVGASNHRGTVDRQDDTIAAFSSRGPTAVDYAAKPDLVAPGVGIYSLSDPNSFLYSSKSQYLLSGTIATSYLPYLTLSGTSQAAPAVAGIVALMLQANPALTPNAVKAILQHTARAYPGYDALTQGAGLVNARGAVELARSFTASPMNMPESPDWSRQIIWGNHRVQGGRLTSDANAWSTDIVWSRANTPQGQNVAWGFLCSTAGCSTDPTAWTRWGTSCANADCSAVVWGSQSSENVVWGTACGGADCQGTSWSTSGSGNGGVEGSSYVDSEWNTIVWGTSCEGTSCQPVIW